jgi:FAD/FMN-containing dehydrogenase
LINTGVLSQSPSQFNSIWAFREGLTECCQKEGKPYKYDVSVPLATFQKVVDAIRERMISKGLYGDHAISKVMGYGHVGDGSTISPTSKGRSTHPVVGNLHLNVIAKHGYRPELEAALEPFIYEIVGEYPFSPRVLIMVVDSIAWTQLLTKAQCPRSMALDR